MENSRIPRIRYKSTTAVCCFSIAWTIRTISPLFPIYRATIDRFVTKNTSTRQVIMALYMMFVITLVR